MDDDKVDINKNIGLNIKNDRRYTLELIGFTTTTINIPSEETKIKYSHKIKESK